jgi:hypothetical protein
MFAIAVVLVLLIALFMSTVRWAISSARGGSREDTAPSLVKVRLWAAGASFFVVLVLIAAAVAGLLRADVSGIERLLAGLNWMPIRVAVVSCAAAGVATLGMCARAVARREWAVRTRVSMVAYAAALVIAVGILLFLAFAG